MLIILEIVKIEALKSGGLKRYFPTLKANLLTRTALLECTACTANSMILKCAVPFYKKKL
jgi:hypothetical protein